MTPDYERARDAANRLSASCYFQMNSPSDCAAERAKLHLASAAAAMGFVLAPMMPEQPAPDKPKPTTGTLAELNVKPGDVVTFGGGMYCAEITGPQEGDRFPARWRDEDEDSSIPNKGLEPWRIVSRASQPAPDDLRAAYDREVLE